MGVTIREVAKLAGVSPAAVSKVLHGRGASIRVSESCAVRIRAAASELCYHPNALARSLRSSRTNTVGLIFENFNEIGAGPLFYMHLLDGVGSELFKKHFRLTILPELDRQNVIGSLSDGLLDGVIWCKMARDEAALKVIHDCPIPIVALNGPAPQEEINAVFVSCDNEGGIELAVEHLWQLGHRKIAFLREHEEVEVPDCRARCEGFERAMIKRGLAIDESEDVLTWSWEMSEFSAWWASQTGHTAIVCWSERSAAQLLRQCTQSEVKVPTQLSVVGFDSTQFSETTSPRLTAVKQPIAEMAAYATRQLLAIIEGNPPSNASRCFECTLDVRDSTAAPQ